MKYVYAGSQAFIEAVEVRLAEAGFQRVSHAAQADVVVTYCTSQTALEDAYFDADGFVQTARPGTLLVDLSASTPNFSRELNAVAVVSDLSYVEAPLAVNDMMRADAFADEANLCCCVAGEDADIARARGLLDALVGAVHVIGGVGTAQLARAAYALQTCAQVVAAIESDALFRAVKASALGGFGEAELYPRMESSTARSVLDAISVGAFSGTYTVEMLMAELSAALMAADDAELILPQAEAAMHLLELLAVIGGAQKAPSALALVYGEEKDCAANGLDWTRAEHAFEDDCGCFDDDCDCGCDHDHDGDDDDFDYKWN